ncbi:MAG: dicarboxylate/amino acid:cation symporter [Firmicutes bacterium]|nr:dicarboxylate/amino acid:cation symporter [Bacillota bacterium]
MKTIKNKPLSSRMTLSLCLALAVGALTMLLRESLLASGNGAVWNTINNLLFADITQNASALGLFYLVGQLFIRALSLIIVPMIYTSLVLAIIRIADATKLRRISIKTIGIFLMTTVMGLALAAIAGFIVYSTGAFSTSIEGLDTASGSTGANPLNVILNIIPSNIFSTLSTNGSVLAVVFLAVTTGLSMNDLGEERTATFKKLLTEFNDIVVVFLNYVVSTFGPVAVFCLLVRSMASYGITYLKPAFAYMVVTTVLLFAYLLLAYPALVALMAKLNPITFIKKIAKVAIFGFSTSSSAATLSLNTKTCQEDFGVSEEITSFVLPLGMTVNMDGTAIMQVVATLFVAGVAGFQVSFPQLILIAMLALVASVGTPAAPGSGAIVLFTILSGVGFTSDTALLAYSLILAINRPIEMLVTALNVVGDATTSIIVAKSEHALDEAAYNK